MQSGSQASFLGSGLVISNPTGGHPNERSTKLRLDLSLCHMFLFSVAVDFSQQTTIDPDVLSFLS